MLLGFVLRMGVSSWVEEMEFVEAVRVIAQVQAFCDYRSAKQRLMYKGPCQRRVFDCLVVFHVFFFNYPVWITSFHPGNRGARFRFRLLKFNNRGPRSRFPVITQ
jgi:hypothetical protein